MATAKKRINISLSDEMHSALLYLAERDEIPQATKASELMRFGLELEEDDVLNQLAQQRDQPAVHFISHDKAWT